MWSAVDQLPRASSRVPTAPHAPPVQSPLGVWGALSERATSVGTRRLRVPTEVRALTLFDCGEK